MGRSYAFIQFGSFSHTNASLLAALRTAFPDHRAHVVDAARLGVMSPASLPKQAWEVLRTYGPAGLAGRERFLRRSLRTRYHFDELGRRVRAALSGQDFEFTIQTQALFDAALPDIPHFLYTDHSHLENLRYPAFDRRELAHDDWIAAERGAYHSACLNFTMSSNIARSLALDYGLPASRALVAGVGSNAMRAAGAEADPRRFERRRILFVGVDWERKGGPVLVEAFRRLRRIHPEAELEIVGCAPEVREPGCRVVGRIPLDAVSARYLEATVFCLPTRMEPFGIVFIEALAHGLPIVGTPIGAIPDLVEEGRTGCLVPPDDPQALADALDRLLRDPVLCRRLGSDGEALVRERYTWDATAGRIASAIRAQLGKVVGEAA